MRYWLYLAFFFSGFSALIYEVAWVRILGFALGNTAQATGCVLAVFMGGLALGAVAAGRIADRFSQRTLLAYGVIEIAIGLVSVVVTKVLQSGPAIFGSLYQQVGDTWLPVLRLLFSGIQLLLPTILMGATLPVLVRFFSDKFAHAGEFFSRLYGLNTLGAVAGSLAATFLGFSYLGLSGTIYLACTINCVVGISAALLSKRSVPSAEVRAAEEETAAPLGNLWLLCLIAGLSGFTALSYEVLWTRLLRLYTTSITYAFTFMVSTFLLGLALGSFIYQKWIARKADVVENELKRFSKVQYAAAAAAAVSLIVLPLAVMWRAKALNPAVNMLEHPMENIIWQAIVTLVAILLPATIIGISFPMIGSLVASRSKSVGKAVGTIYGANTIGCVFGSLLSSMVFVPVFGTYKAFAVTIFLSIFTGLLCAAAAAKKNLPMMLASGSVAAVLVVYFFQQSASYSLPVSNASQKLLKYSEDYTGTICVVDYPETKSRLLAINGASYALTILPCKRYMRLLGHLPVLLHPNPKTALNICFGTGTTGGSVALHPEIERLDIVDLSPEVLKSAQFFTESNHGVLDKAKVKPRVDDGRNFLLCTQNKYDVLTFEPPPPVESGIVNLYSKEFYELAKSRLNDGGIICQWVPLHEQSDALWKQLVKSAREVFPYVSIWEPSTGEALIVASTKPLNVDPAVMRKRLDSAPEVKANLDEVGLGSAEALLASYLSSGKHLDDYVGSAPAVTDDHPTLEFFLPYAGPLPYAYKIENPNPDPELFGTNKPSPEFLAKLKTNRDALSLTRHAYEQATPEGRAKSLADAAKLVPENPWFQYLLTHKWVLENAYTGSSQRKE
jgi:spermidine synthase